MIDNLEPKPNMWETNPKLKMLSLVFIFVFLFSGIALVMFSVWSNQYRQKIYEETQNSLPKHGVGVLENQKVGVSDIASWKTYKNDQYGFELKYPAGWILRDKIFEADCEAQNKKDCLLDIANYDIAVSYQSLESMALVGVTYCGAYAGQNERCEIVKNENFSAVVDWNIFTASFNLPNSGTVGVSLNSQKSQNKETARTIFKTFKSTKPIDTSNWKTYKNDRYGFSLNYPVYSLDGDKTNIAVLDATVPEDGPGAFWGRVSIDIWQRRFKAKNSYKIGDDCAKINSDGGVDLNEGENNCSVLSLDPYVLLIGLSSVPENFYSLNFINKDFQLILSPLPENIDKDVLNKILSTFKFTNLQKAVLKCENYNFGNCPSSCVAQCLPSQCSPGGPCTEDCNGPGSCVNPK